MEDKKIQRINELARQSRERELTPEEKAEQKALREEYIAAFRSNRQNYFIRSYENFVHSSQPYRKS